MSYACVLAAFVLINFIVPAKPQSYNDTTMLMTDVLKNYDRRQRPVLNQSEPVVVYVTFMIIAIQDFDEVSEKFSVVGLFAMVWKDDLITWDAKDYGGTYSTMLELDDIWYPKLVLTNPYSKLQDLGASWMTVRFSNTGYGTFVPGAVFETICSVDVTYYPFDTQTCWMSFTSWGYLGYEVVLIPAADEVGTTYYSPNGEWDLLSTSVIRIPGETYTSDTLVFTFQLKRKPTFLVVNVILPIIFMAMINLLVFILPAESGERVGFCVTVLLALAVFMTLVADNLPKTSKPMAVLSYYLMIVLILSTLMTVVTIVNLRVYFKKTDVPSWCGCFTGAILCVRCRFRPNNSMETVKLSKVYPLEKDPKKRTQRAEKHDASQDQPAAPEITWSDVSKAVDLLALILFLSATIIVNAVFMNILVYNKSTVFQE